MTKRNGHAIAMASGGASQARREGDDADGHDLERSPSHQRPVALGRCCRVRRPATAGSAELHGRQRWAAARWAASWGYRWRSRRAR